MNSLNTVTRSNEITIQYQGNLGSSLQIIHLNGDKTQGVEIPTDGLAKIDLKKPKGTMIVSVNGGHSITELSTILSNGKTFSLCTKSLFEFFSKVGQAEKNI